MKPGGVSRREESRRGQRVALLLLVPAVVLIAVGAWFGAQAERDALLDRARSDARRTLTAAADLIRAHLEAKAQRALDAARVLLRTGTVPPDVYPTDDDPVAVVFDRNDRRIAPPPARHLVALSDVLANVPAEARETLDLARALAARGKHAAARTQLSGLITGSSSETAAQARFRVAVVVGDARTLRDLATAGVGLSSAQRFSAFRAALLDAVQRRDEEVAGAVLEDAWHWIRGLILAKAVTARPWITELSAIIAVVDERRGARLLHDMERLDQLAARLTAVPPPTSWGTGPNLSTTAGPARIWRETDDSGTRLGSICLMPPVTIDMEPAATATVALKDRGWAVVEGAPSGGDDVAVAIGGPLPNRTLVATPTRRTEFFPWRTLLGATFLLGCVGLIGAGAILSSRSARQRERLVEQRAEFLATVAHQLKTPVANVRMFTETLASGVDDDEDRERMQGIIQSETQRLSDQIERILAVTRLDETEDGPERVEIPLTPMFEDMLGHWRRSAEAREVSLEAEGIEDLGSAFGDPRGLRDAVHNVVDNALRFARSTVRLRCDAGLIEVMDDGPGFPREHRERVFDRFFRCDESKVRAGEGSGLGLAIAKEGVERAGGRIEFVFPSDGTHLRILLPRPGEDPIT